MGGEIKRNKKKRTEAEAWREERRRQQTGVESNNEHTHSRCKVLESFTLDFFLGCRGWGGGG